MAATVHQIDEAGGYFSVGGADLVRVPDGVYKVVYQSHATANMFGKPRLIVRFKIYDGEHKGKVLESFYLVSELIGKPGKKGKFRVTQKSGFIRDFVRATNYSPDRLDRIPMTRLRGFVIMARVETVTHDHERDPLPECLQYSKIKKLLAGNPG